MTGRLILLLVAVLGVPLVLVGYITLAEAILARLPVRRRAALRPWLWLTPAAAFLLVFLVYPAINTVIISLFDARSNTFVGLANYRFVVADGAMRVAIRNNVLWLIFFTGLVVVFGLLIAVLTDRLRYEAAAKAIIFLPMAISFVAAGVIWKFMYDFRPAGTVQTGTVNAALSSVLPGFSPHAWLINRSWNNIALIVAAVWIWTGFATVILSAGLKGIPTDIMEAARVDGASEWQTFWRIVFPLLSSTLAVVTTTMVITALKAFDIVYVMTNGNYNTDVIANRMYKELFNFHDFGRASAIAVILLVAVVPVVAFNLRRFREQEGAR